MIRVLHVLGGLNRGGAETMVMNFYRYIDKSEVQFDFIIHSDSQNDYREEIESMGGKIYVFPKFKVYNILSYRNTWKSFFDAHPEYRIIHSHIRSYASVFFPIAKKYHLKTIIHSHSTSNGKGFKAIIKNILQKPLVKQADYLFACSESSGKWLYGTEKIKEDNYFLVKNSIDVNKYKCNEKIRTKYRNALNIENNLVFAHVGRLSSPKNHIFLLKVFKGILEKNSKSILLIIGDGELKEEINTKIKDLNLKGKVYMMGSREDVDNILQAVDVFLFPSFWEGLPVAVVEAEASGLPCILSESVTEEVKLLPNLKYLPINQGEGVWVNYILNMKKNRLKEASEIVRSKGFDIRDTTRWLLEFYKNLAS